MSLEDLPLELLNKIVDLTLPHGIEAFALTCKAVYKCAESQIKRHNALKQQWKHTVHFGNPLVIIHETIRSPLAGEYIEWLDLWDRRHAGTRDSEASQLHGEPMEKVRETVLTSGLLQDAGADTEEWWDTMIKEQRDSLSGKFETAPYTTVFLLSMLPNLKKLQLPPTWAEASLGDPDNPEIWVTALDAIGERANGLGGSGKALAILEYILPCMSQGYDERASLLCLQPFMPLKAIAHMDFVSCVAVDDGYTYIPYHWRYSNLSSPLRRVEFAFCCMDADGISELLPHIPSLEVFRYSHQSKREGCGYEWNPGSFIEMIGSHVGQTITELAITIDDCDGGIINGASSFLCFPKLQILEVDILIFRGPCVESGQRLGTQPYVPEDEEPWSEDDIPCIGGMLPPSVVEVHLNTDFPKANKAALNVILKNYLEERAQRLTKMKRFVIREYKTSTCIAIAQRTGVEFECYRREGRGRIVRAMMPLWKRDFEARVDEAFQ
jgi:hypothetical protein